ncbi:hypothetical protein A3A68_02235 [Candidatus Saccharibacteria bacterium RIFCSPLOWO2_01_FULL_48_13]|nr:MAG: hypothetical protein A2884_02010 [Candidatus Saccharibacteria bacterium RIFCSPHIGHO2_01_FULL_48_12]OGL35202.1 MAG: hypothetical protein A3F38_02950 [Candidatus Saccharibacteria bacterium RIFCSPHIGHO2_12_FULL_48_21]OGL36747.1 MAG: hypothetical protein A3A68_02235 [Candidatus Saccharibacteria bacterium RIFCSPLOWO2_01_FULL_48_13]
MKAIIELQNRLQKQAKELLDTTPVLVLLGKLGQVTQTGSSTTGLMVYPDIDFAVQTIKPNVQDAINLVPVIFAKLSATSCKVADFRTDSNEGTSYFIGFEFPYNGKSWQISATVGKPGPITTNPPALSNWLKNMSEQQRETILELKKELINSKRYAGAKSQPPYTFRSVHLYEAVLQGGSKTIHDIESYFGTN